MNMMRRTWHERLSHLSVNISKYEQQSSDLISDAIKHGIVCGGMAHQGLKQHIDLSISRLSTCKALRDEIINYCRARRTWTDPNAMQVDAVHVNVHHERQVDGSGSRSDKGKGGKGKFEKEGKGKERGERAATKFDGECRYCQKKGHKKSDCRKMKSDIAAGKCDKGGKPMGGQCTLSGRRNEAFPASELCTEHGKHHPIATDGASVLPMSRRQSDVSTDGNVVHQHDRTGPEDSHCCKLGTLLGSGSGLTSCPINHATDIPLLPRLANLPNATGGSVECIGQRQVGYRLENGEQYVVTWHVASHSQVRTSR